MMGTIMFWNGKILFSDEKIAMGPDCCCEMEFELCPEPDPHVGRHIEFELCPAPAPYVATAA